VLPERSQCFTRDASDLVSASCVGTLIVNFENALHLLDTLGELVQNAWAPGTNGEII
jgi:hypothetical protein